MQWFIAYFDAAQFGAALREVGASVQCGDRVTVMAAVIVPGSLPVNAPAGAIWKQVCRAEQQLFHARQSAKRSIPDGVEVRFVRVQARDRATAIITGASHYRADCIVLPTQPGVRGFFAARFGSVHTVLTNAPCAVRFIDMQTPAADQHDARREAPVPFARPESALSTLHIIVTNPEIAPSPIRQSGAHHAS